ncbi:hypothetical protein PUNSTDRAFT_43200 [Punctularia strigosozonata HHB-11173 SS5]|uniref:uncharacterized protein n=1 Tax=Punctularia strigosozonata (strain HHB-11173) TaxID=741275 RepID=UPI00044183BA|nr:uncharacterized protein PUNSTDRAFT_43200 [Punctularia strigosozonata HHB-11173 SS5]EIN10217.1 hypothetical protein PUNSTDRAFT_43200 [Punctularia strigosozonata HHB-11173 SS5]
MLMKLSSLAAWLALSGGLATGRDVPPSGTSTACTCNIGTIPVAVDVRIPSDPSLPINTTDTRRIHEIYDIFGVLCAPNEDASSGLSDRVQLLLHGNTYTTAYWTFPYNGFRNYSYVAYSCERGLSSFAFDMVGSGLSTRPSNSSDIQLFVASNVTSSLSAMLKDGTVSRALGGSGKRFSKVVAFGHSLGAVTLNWVAIALGSRTPFDAFVPTGHIHDPGFIVIDPVQHVPAREVDPARWGNLDPGYITTPNISARATFYSTDTTTFSSQVLMIDELTKDLGSSAMAPALEGAVYVPATGFTGPVAIVVGEDDQVHCVSPGNDFLPCNITSVLAQERPFYSDSKNVTAFVVPKTGHDLDLQFTTNETFQLFTDLVNELV